MANSRSLRTAAVGRTWARDDVPVGSGAVRGSFGPDSPTPRVLAKAAPGAENRRRGGGQGGVKGVQYGVRYHAWGAIVLLFLVLGCPSSAPAADRVEPKEGASGRRLRVMVDEDPPFVV